MIELIKRLYEHKAGKVALYVAGACVCVFLAYAIYLWATVPPVPKIPIR